MARTSGLALAGTEKSGALSVSISPSMYTHHNIQLHIHTRTHAPSCHAPRHAPGTHRHESAKLTLSIPFLSSHTHTHTFTHTQPARRTDIHPISQAVSRSAGQAARKKGSQAATPMPVSPLGRQARTHQQTHNTRADRHEQPGHTE